MRILHVGCGFRPWRRGGLVAYVEDLMAEQVRRGDEVAYFFSGRVYPGLRGPWLRRWVRDDIPLFEVVNSPLYDHGRQPVAELGEPGTERLLGEAIDEFRPDVLHLQELAGLPVSVLEVARARGVPTVVTLQDYFFVCPNFKLLDARGRVCLRREVGADCLATTAADPRPAGAVYEATASYDLERLPVLRGIEPARRTPAIRRVARAVGRHAPPHVGPQGDAADFQRRREVHVERLSEADCVIAMSQRVADIHMRLGVDPTRLRILQLTLAHIEHLRPRVAAPADTVTFATLGAFESVAKGGRLVVEAARLLSQSPAAARVRILVFGWIAPSLAEEAAGLDVFDLRGTYGPSELDGMLDEVDVGLMPSIWEEAYGYAGVEFLAKGIPVVANAMGGMPEYVREGETGWVNGSSSPEELARIMVGIAERPEQVVELNAGLRASRDRIVKGIAAHADEMNAVYTEVTA